jgi:molybdopterin/thiamine biosynthesis adenylyltransferase
VQMGQNNASASLEQVLAGYRVAQEDGQGTLASISHVQVLQLAARHERTTREIEIAALVAEVYPARYARNYGTVGREGQLRLLQSTVAVVGAGGIGGWVIEGLARMGVGQLVIIDYDHFADNNLNRQLGCTEASLGRPKAEVLAERVAVVNSAVQVRPHMAMLDEHDAAVLLDGAQVVVDALDSLPARKTLEQAARQLGIPLVHGAIGGYGGHVLTIFPGAPGLAALYGDRLEQPRGVEVRLGNPAATPMMIAAWQIHEVVKILLGQGELLRGRALFMDAEFGQVSEVHLVMSSVERQE